MRFIARTMATAIFGTVLVTTPLSAQTVTIDYDHTVNFLKFKTYTWEKIHATDPGVEDRINIALKRDMEGRYMTEVASGGDVTITAVDATQDKAEFINFYGSLSGFDWQHISGATGFLDSGTALQDVPLDTLIIDIYNPTTHQLLWRGAVTEPVAKSEDKNGRTIDHAVTLLISKYPPRYKKP
jgi:hypothetical protein